MAKFGGFGGGMGNIQNMLKEAQKMQEDMKLAQAELDEMSLNGVSGGGLVTVTVNGKSRVTGVKIKPEAVDLEDLEMLEDLILSAYNKACELAQAEYDKLMPAGLNGLM
ncbi:MAG: YbaB/EbfC family nucleoid-associated protein [Firmicutes bacterium]|nr:YbaB/EbfC family nucleoid-associated protein [Bacillota bacterium]MCL1953509.1 YbaB/EbfC family nucleoid-associated protein [Bacillota bacterium]